MSKSSQNPSVSCPKLWMDMLLRLSKHAQCFDVSASPQVTGIRQERQHVSKYLGWETGNRDARKNGASPDQPAKIKALAKATGITSKVKVGPEMAQGRTCPSVLKWASIRPFHPLHRFEDSVQFVRHFPFGASEFTVNAGNTANRNHQQSPKRGISPQLRQACDPNSGSHNACPCTNDCGNRSHVPARRRWGI